MKKAGSIFIGNATCLGLLNLALVLLMALAICPSAALAQDITVSGSPHVGVLPQIITAFVVDGDVLPAGGTDYYVFTLFDTGSTRIYFDFTTAASLGVTDGLTTDIRINGLAAIDPGTLYAPIYAGQAQAEVPAIPVSLPASPLDRTLIGGPVTNVVRAVIDYTTAVSRGPYSYLGGAYVEGPDITFYPAGSPVGFTPAITLSLEAFGSISPDDPGKGQRYYMHSVSFNEGGFSWASPPSGEDIPNNSLKRFLYDTGTTPTMLRRPVADALGLEPGAWEFQVQVGNDLLDGYYLDSITMAGEGGTYTVSNAPVIVTDDVMGGAADARIGSNLFSQVKLLFDGPAATLGISLPSTNEAPVAGAGADQVIEAMGPTTPFTLSGAGSSDPDGDTLTYSWTDEYGTVVGEEETVVLSRSVGTYVFILTVTDPGGLTSTDDVLITIQDTTPPALTPPPDITDYPESDPMGTAVYLGEPMVSDVCDPDPSVVHDAPTLFPLGPSVVTWTATDDFGNTATATQTVTVVPGTPLNQLSNLAKLVNYSVMSGGIAPEMQTSLLAKINAAIAALVKGNPSARKVAMNDLKALSHQVEAQTDKKILPLVATEIITRANRIIVALGG